MVLDHRQNHLESIRAAMSMVIYPIQYVINLPFSVTDWAGENLSSRETLLKENAQLRIEHTLYKAQLQKLAALQVENMRLRELLQSSKKVGENVLIAELLTVDMEPFSRQIVINKGSEDHVYLGQPLLDAEGIMGQIIHVGPFSSTAMLITDSNHAIPVHVNRNGLRALVMGTGAPDTLDIPYLPNSADIVVGDLLTSSGLGGRFPRDYPVARVTSVTKDSTRPYATVTAEPIALLERSREVLLVWPASADEPPKTAEGEEPSAEPTPAPPDATTQTPAAAAPAAPVPPRENTAPEQQPAADEGLL